MILTNCAACAAPLAHDAPTRCVRCHTRYCSATCLDGGASRDDVVKAVALFDALLATAQRIYGPSHPKTAKVQIKVGNVREKLALFPLVISVAGLQGDEVNFKVNPTTRLQRIFDAYANRKGIALASFRFLFKGSRVDGKLTCADIGLEDGDQLEAENVQDAVAARDE